MHLILSLLHLQGLPSLAAVSGETPSRVDTRSVLRPLKGAGLDVHAGRALGHEPGSDGVQRSLPGAIMPRRLTPLNPLTSIPEERGKGPLGGKPFPKKLTLPAGEGVDGAEEGTGLASPPFETTRPLPPIAASTGPTASPLPPIGSSNLPPPSSDLKKPPLPPPKLSLPGQRPAVPSMPSRQAPSDPFSSDSQPVSPSRLTLGSAPAGPPRMPPTRPSISRAPPTPFATTSPKKEPDTAANSAAEKTEAAGPASDAGQGTQESGTAE